MKARGYVSQQHTIGNILVVNIHTFSALKIGNISKVILAIGHMYTAKKLIVI
jgi:hypothetical protein